MYNSNQFLVSHCLISLSVIFFCDQSGYIQTDPILNIVTHTVVKKQNKEKQDRREATVHLSLIYFKNKIPSHHAICASLSQSKKQNKTT